MTGGYTGEMTLSSTILLDSTTMTWTRGPELPLKVNAHCLAAINATHTFMAGGADEDDLRSDAAFVFSWTTREWTKLPSMPARRELLACHLTPDRESILAVGK